MRIITPAMGTGQAAGLAASLAVERNLSPRELDGAEVRALLISDGVDLDKPCDGYWQELRDMDCDFSINGGDFLTCIPKESSAS